jgi:hypothetical protein
MNYLVIYEFEKTLENRYFDTLEEIGKFLEDPEREICQDGDFVKYFVVYGDFKTKSGFIDRT